MKSNKTIQKKFRIDSNTDRLFQQILSSKKVSMQFVLESMLKEYIYKNFDIILKSNK